MRLKRLKKSTKDCDILVKDAADFKSVTSALWQTLGYSDTSRTQSMPKTGAFPRPGY